LTEVILERAAEEVSFFLAGTSSESSGSLEESVLEAREGLLEREKSEEDLVVAVALSKVEDPEEAEFSFLPPSAVFEATRVVEYRPTVDEEEAGEWRGEMGVEEELVSVVSGPEYKC
jgi:hypothetical protein